ncbi:MAG TPA: AMP-binding protein [Chloroflexota bacterium]|nr:AMP-binding protein [Chloroflexota bacterium]
MNTPAPTNLYEIIRQRAARYPNEIALGGAHGVGWRTVDSLELLALTDRLASELADTLGISAGDRVVLWLPNAWQSPIYHFALWKLGAIVVPFDRDMNASAARAILASVEPRAMIVGYGERPEWLADDLTVADWWEPGARGGVARDGFATEDLAVLAFTSGTTGNPKGCMISHRNLLHEVDILGDCVPAGPGCRLASVLPLSHLFELTCGMLYPIAVGAAVHYVPSRRGPDILAVLQQQRVTHLIAVPQLLTLMGKAIDDQLRKKLPPVVYRSLIDLADRAPFPLRRRLFFMVHQKLGNHLQLIASGGAALPPETHRQWERFGVRVAQGYGASECAPVVACGAPDGSTPIGSVGKPIRGERVRFTAEGELEVRGPNVMAGYWRDPERTAQVLRDGWYATGDLARQDENGNLWILGRARDLIVLPSGMNVWPEDLENALRAQPGVKDAAVVAVPNEQSGAVLHAYLIGDGAAADPREIIARANRQLAAHQRLASASWWQSESGDFPRTSTLKVRRHLLPRPSGAGLAAPPPIVGDPVARAIARVTGQAPARGDQTLGELGLDSLTLLELQVQLEDELGLPLSEGLLRGDQTVGALRAAIEALDGSGGETSLSGEGDSSSGGTPGWPYTWGRVFRALGFPLDLLLHFATTPVVIRGGDYLRELPPAVILAGTHRSYPDLFLLRAALGKAGRTDLRNRLIIATASTHYANAGALGAVATLIFGLYPIQQHRGQRTSLSELARLAHAGNAVLIFPQGHHTDPARERAGDPAANFRPGVAHLATALSAAVVPFGTAGSENLVPPRPPDGFRGVVIPGNIPLQIHRAPAAIAFGPPLTPEPGESASAFTARVQRVCFDLARQAEEALATRSAI